MSEELIKTGSIIII